MVNNIITVIIPVYNRFKVTERAIQSVLAQTYTNWELFIVDDNSNEAFVLPESCKSNQQKITVLRNEQNIGPGLSRQIALDLTNGHLVCFLDSDDYYHPSFFEKSLTIHERNPNISATYSTAKYIQTDEIREGSNVAYEYVMPTLFEAQRPWPTCGWMWKRRYISRWKPLRTNQDSLFELDCCFINNNIRHIPEVLCFIDKGTGQNTADLVKAKASDRHRNVVALHALKNRHRIEVAPTDQARLNLAIRNRVVYVSSKLAGHGYGLDVMKNGLKLMSLSWKAGFFLLLLGIPVLLPSRAIHNVVKKIILGTSK